MTYRYEFKTEPYAHQKTALRRAWRRQGYAYLMEMGTGKSKVVVDEIGMYFELQMCDCAVILAPKGVYRNWLTKEFPNHLPERIPRDVGLWRPGGGNKTQQRELKALLTPNGRLRILIMNLEALSSGELALAYLRKFINSGVCYGAVDESTFIMGPDSIRTRRVLSVAPRLFWRRILTGSPIGTSPLDLFSQFEFIGEGLLGASNWFAFRATYANLKNSRFTMKRKNSSGDLIDTGKTVKIIVNYRNLDKLNAKLEQHSYRVLKEDCLDLPPKTYTTRDVDLTEEQARVYNELVANSIAELEGAQTVTTTLVLTKLLRLQQVACGHVTDDDGDLQELPSNRPEALVEILREAQGKAIIWSTFQPDIARIVKTLGKEFGRDSVAQFHGGNANTRHLDEARWLNEPGCRWMVSSQQSGGFGNTWLPGTTVVYYSNHRSLLVRQQSEDRPHRSGQTQRVTYVDMLARGTKDRKIIETLRKNMDLAAQVTGDNWREWVV